MDVGAQKVEAISNLIRSLSGIVLVLGLVACASRPILKEQEGQFDDIKKEYEKVVHVQTISPTPTPKVTPKPTPVAPTPAPGRTPTPTPKIKMKPHLPDLEDKEDFNGRRPLVDPFSEGEEAVYNVQYLGMSAGEMKLSVNPMKIVNNKKAYHFTVNVKSNTRFSMFYSVDNTAETFLDFETMLPITLAFDNNESARLVESKTFFDWQKLEASMWEKRVSKKSGEKKKQIKWKIEPYSQNTISALFYLRAFKLHPGKKLAFRVANDGKNVIFKAEVLGREELKTDVGTFQTLVVKPEVHVDGSLKPTGDILLWISDDERKNILKIESKVKIGTLIGKIKTLKR